MPRDRCLLMTTACSCLAWVFLATLGPAQGLASGAISGVVEPSQSNAVVFRNLETGVELTTLASADGTFTVINLPPGPYGIRIGGAVSSQAVFVDAATTSRLRLRVVGASVSVSGTPTAEVPASGPKFEEDDDGQLSSRGLQTEQAGSVIDGVSADQALASVPVGTGGAITLDAAEDADSADINTGPSHGLGRGRHSAISYLYAEGSVREFRVATGTYSAQVGSAGNVLASVTRQGGETLHGSAFLHLRSSILAAKDPLALATTYAGGQVTSSVVKPHDLRQNFGGTLGGDVAWLPKLRYFVAAEGQRRGFPAVSSPSDPHFYELTAVQKALLGTRGVGFVATAAALSYISSLTGTTDRRADEDVEFGRVDWLARPGLSAGLQYNRARWSSPAGLVESPVVARGRASLGNSSGSVDQVLARVNTNLLPRLSQELQIAFTRDLQYESPQTPLPQEPGIGPGGMPPEVNIGPNGILFGTPAGLSRRAYPQENRLELRDVATARWGEHFVQLGGSYGRVEEQIATLPDAAGSFRYDSEATRGRAGGLVDFITDYTFNVNGSPNGACPSILAVDHLFCFRSFSQSFGQTRVTFPTANWAIFAEDTWRPAARVSFHAGLRYEYVALPQPIHPNPAIDLVFGKRGLTSAFPRDRNNLGPRVAATLEPFGRGRGLLKIGYGVFFGRMPGATIASALTGTGLQTATTRIRIRPTTITACPQAPSNGFGYPCSFTSAPDDVVTATQSIVVLDRRFRLPVVQQGSLTLEREFGRRTVLSVEAVINEDRQLPSSTDLNVAPSSHVGRFQLQGGTGAKGVRDGETFVVPVYTNRIAPQFGPVTDVISSVNATYDGLILRVASRPVSSLQINARYTWSKAIDFGQTGSATPRTNAQFDPFANGYDKSLSSLNYPHAVRVSAVWEPRLEANELLQRLANGWIVSAVSVARSGRPYSFDLSGGPYLAGGHESINGSGGALYLPTVGRNTLRLPPTIRTDLRIARAFRIRHGLQGEASVEGFNIFNHQSISSVNQRAYLVGTEEEGVTPLVFQDAARIAAEGLNTTAFGTTIGTGSSLSRERQIEISLRASF